MSEPRFGEIKGSERISNKEQGMIKEEGNGQG